MKHHTKKICVGRCVPISPNDVVEPHSSETDF
jgi:hypothetical protein